MRVLLVDDDPGLRLALSKALARKGVDVVDLAGGEAALEALKSGVSAAGPVDVVVLDLRMPGMGGLEVLRRTPHRRVPVVVLTGHGSVPDAVEAMRLGAADFMQKPVDADELLPILRQALRQASRQEPPEVAHTLLGASEVMLDFLHKLDRAGLSDEPLLLVGETGTGKALCAQRIHAASVARRGPFVALDAAAAPRELVEAELFGQRRGAFALAQEAREGLLGRAAEGTLFIDDLDALPLEVQGKLARAIEEQRFRAVGGDVERPLRARVVAATQRDPRLLAERGVLREDLLYRVGVLTLHVPPLRQRGDDVVLIARATLGRSADRPLTLSAAAEERLRHHAFPGNVRELMNIMKRAALFARGDTVDVGLVDELLRDSPFFLEASAGEEAPRAGQRVTLEELEKTHIRRLLGELNNVSEVARIVGIDRRTLQRKMAAWGMREHAVDKAGEPAGGRTLP